VGRSTTLEKRRERERERDREREREREREKKERMSSDAAANAAVGGEFLARALGTVLAARIGGPLVVSSDARSSSGSGAEERLWVRQCCFRRPSPTLHSFRRRPPCFSHTPSSLL
jgi:hypothetical protein